MYINPKDRRTRAEEVAIIISDTLLAYAAECVQAERERAAKVCEEMDASSYPTRKHFGSEYAAAIRKLEPTK